MQSIFAAYVLTIFNATIMAAFVWLQFGWQYAVFGMLFLLILTYFQRWNKWITFLAHMSVLLMGAGGVVSIWNILNPIWALCAVLVTILLLLWAWIVEGQTSSLRSIPWPSEAYEEYAEEELPVEEYYFKPRVKITVEKPQASNIPLVHGELLETSQDTQKLLPSGEDDLYRLQ